MRFVSTPTPPAEPVARRGPSASRPRRGASSLVITVEEAGVTYGVNGWKSNATDIGRYREERP
jgi:hypothetical protein